jgi:hypothetical protein
MAAGIAFGVLISEATYYFLQDGEARSPQVFEIRIPPGTAQQVRAGASEQTLPDSMTFIVGDTLIVRNEDVETHQLGPVLVPAGASASLHLDTAQEYAATCSFQPDRYFGIRVRAPLTLQTRAIGVLEAGIPMGFLFILYGVFAIPGKKAVE